MLRKFVLVFAFLSSLHTAQAAHIIGGDVTYRCLMIDSANMQSTYEIIMTVYRDSRGGGANFDPNAKLGLFEGGGSVWDFVQQLDIGVINISDITFGEDPCIIIPPTVGVEKGTYRFTLTLPWSNRTYKIAYQRCCRNNTITNIRMPGETGAVFSVDIMPEAQTSCNNSPTFNEFPPIVICAGQPLDIDQSATDAEGDQLVYEFCTPLAAGGTAGATTQGDPNSCIGVTPDPFRCRPPFEEVEFQLPNYSTNNPLGAASGVMIDPATGKITGRPELLGQYVVGVCVKEFRNGKLIGEIRRDFQFNVAICEIAVQASLEPNSDNVTLDTIVGKNFTINACGATTVNITNLSQDPANIDAYLWEMDIAGSTQTATTRDAGFSFPGLGTYSGRMILNPGSVLCSDTAFLTINIFPAINSDFTYAYDTCLAGPIDFTDLSTTGADEILSWQWSYDDGGSDDIQNPSHRFPTPGDKAVTLRVRDNNDCVAEITKLVPWNPVPDLIIIEPSQFIGCNPAEITFTNLSTPIDETYDILWDFGDGQTGTDISPTHRYTEEGIYDVNLEIISPIGCFASRSFPQLIEIKTKPTADFTYSPENPSGFRKEVFFTDQSIDANGWFWDFGGIGAAFEQNPSFDFPDTGMYDVKLVVVHPEGCTDTMIQVIDVVPLISLHLPNAFTPNNDGLNDSFRGVGLVDGLKEYRLTIWNRWGAQVFQSEDSSVGWNGELQNSGQLAPQGVYVYTLQYLGPRGEPKSQKGHITLIR